MDQENTNKEQNRKGINFPMAIFAIILGSAILKQFDFKRMEFEKPALAILYIVVFLAAIFLLIKDRKGSAT